MSRYAIKTDDILLKLLKDYHQIDTSEVMAFFGERAKEMLECEPNITEKCRQNRIFIDKDRTRTVASKVATNTNFLKENKVYVLRGFYPETNLPFKMTLVKFHDFPEAKAKVILGLKEHQTIIKEDSIKIYQEAVSEAILLDQQVANDAKIEYKERKFKGMRPKGMSLYPERIR